MPYKDKNQQKKAQHESYLRNKRLIADRVSKRRKRIRELVRALKDGQKCMDCKIKWPSFVLDYHHRDPESKISGIRRMIAENRSESEILKEIEKCDLICSNCHRIREYAPS